VIIMGVDPGTGASSYTGVGVFDTNTKEIYGVYILKTVEKTADKRIRECAEEFDRVLDNYLEQELVVCLETTVMQGKGGQTYQKLVGAFVGRIPLHVEIRHVYNTSVKLTVGGTGKAAKEQVAAGVLKYFSSNKASAELVQELIDNEDWDETDALAVGITGHAQNQIS
jgi:Holliday junction resolvasome RuvABC endonuclease subunit